MNRFRTCSHAIPLIPESSRYVWSTTDTESSLGTDTESSDGSVPIQFERKIITNGGQYDISFLQNSYKKRKNRGCVHPKWPRSCTKTTPDKLSLYKIIKKLHKFKGSIPKFRDKYKNYHTGYKRYISKIRYHTWMHYSADYKIGSAKFEQLKKYIKNNKAKTSKRKKRFYLDPEIASFGLFPKFEKYLVLFREVVANEYEWRSIQWFRNEGKRILKNPRLLKLLKPLMKKQEWQLLPEFKCTRSYINNVVVIYICMIIQ